MREHALILHMAGCALGRPAQLTAHSATWCWVIAAGSSSRPWRPLCLGAAIVVGSVAADGASGPLAVAAA
eukprot:15191706-Heterocapsa_arctica.AAC.1